MQSFAVGVLRMVLACRRHAKRGGLRLCQYHRHSLQSQKNWGCYGTTVCFAGLVPTNNKTKKIIFDKI